MIHDPALVERLDGLPKTRFEGEVFRATRSGLDPLAPSTRGGRWAWPDGSSVLYTSRERDGALAELSFHWSLLTPLPSKPAAIHRLRVATRKSLRLIEADLATLGVDPAAYRTIHYPRTQAIGEAVAFLECDGLLVPSARWPCENLVVFASAQRLEDELKRIETEEVTWKAWAAENGFLDNR